MKNLKYSLLMALAALIWGSAFVAQKLGADRLDAYTFNSIRSFIGSAALALVSATIGRAGARRQLASRAGRIELLLGGLACGLVLTLSALLQQLGLGETTAGKAGFITTLYILIVPILGLAFGRKVPPPVWLGVALAIAGMYLLCIKEGFAIARGDLLVLFCAMSFSCHILVIDHFARRVDNILLSQIQFLFCGVFSLVPVAAGAVPVPTAGAVWSCILPLLYTAILSSGVAYTLQIVAQSRLEPSVASLLMSLESVFAVLSGWLCLGERLSARELCGCALVFAAVILAQKGGGEGGR